VLLILVVDERQDRHIDEIIQTQHKMPRPLIPLTMAVGKAGYNIHIILAM
jgi:hypothetical protein